MLNKLKRILQIVPPPHIVTLPEGKEIYCFYAFSFYRFRVDKSVKGLFQFIYDVAFTNLVHKSLSDHMDSLSTELKQIEDYIIRNGGHYDVVETEVINSFRKRILEVSKICDLDRYVLMRIKFELLRLRLILEAIYMIIKEYFTLKPSNI